MVEIAPGLAGANTLATLCVLVNGSSNVDMADSAIDLTQFVQAGQTFVVTGDVLEYTIDSIEAAPGAVSNNRLVLASAYAGTSGSAEAMIYDKRMLLVQGQTVVDNYSAPTIKRPASRSS